MTGTPPSNPVQPDEDTETLPTDGLSEETLAPKRLAQNASSLETLVELLNRPALARVYVYVCYWESVTPTDVVDALELPKSTAYEYLDQLVDRGLVERDESTRPQRLTADPVSLIEQRTPVIVTPTVLHAFALQEVDEDVEYFLDRYGIGKLIAALRGAGLHFAGKMTQRMVADNIDVNDTEAMQVINALVPVLAIGRDHDPYFASLFPDVYDAMDLPDLGKRETIPERPPTETE